MHLGKGFVRTLWKKMEAAGATFWRGFANYCLNVFNKFSASLNVFSKLAMNILDAGVCMKIVWHIEDTDTQMEDFLECAKWI
jgi:hypothetical protein